MLQNLLPVIVALITPLVLLSCASSELPNDSTHSFPVPIVYSCVVPDAVPDVLNMTDSSGMRETATTHPGKVLYRFNHEYGWFSCLEQFLGGTFDPFTSALPHDPRHGFSIDGRLLQWWAQGFTDCRNTIREIGQKDQAATLREQLLKMRDEFNKRPEIVKARAELAALPNRDDANITNNQPVLAKYHEIESYLSKEWRAIFMQESANPKK